MPITTTPELNNIKANLQIRKTGEGLPLEEEDIKSLAKHLEKTAEQLGTGITLEAKITYTKTISVLSVT